ncbi:hypothetical protein Tco_0011141 [Tanacetum coccineum]
MYLFKRHILWSFSYLVLFIYEVTPSDVQHSTATQIRGCYNSSSGPILLEMTHVTISSGLVPNPPPSTPFVPPSRTDWDILFQPMFDELLTPPPSVDLPAPEVIAPIDEVVAPVPAYQARPTEKHLHAVKRIFRYLKETVNQGLWYPKDSSIALTAFADADHAGCQDTRRSTSSSM